MLKVEGVEVGYGALEVLHHVTLEVGPGEAVAVIGANGAGKTTLMRVISGLAPPKRGRVVFDGMDVTRWPAHRRVEAGIALVPEGRLVFPDQTVLDNLLLGAYVVARHREEVQVRLEEVLGRFPQLRGRSGQLAGTLSGGEQQMLAIGRALMSRPKLLLLDEPSQGLAPLVVENLFAILGEIRQRGTAVLVVEQVQAVLEHVDRGLVLRSGRIALESGARSLIESDATREAFFGHHMGSSGASKEG